MSISPRGNALAAPMGIFLSKQPLPITSAQCYPSHFLNASLAVQMKPYTPLIPTPLWQFHGKMRLWSQRGPRRERKARKRRQRRRMSEKEQRRPHAGSTSDTKHLFLTTKRSLRSLTLPLVVILSSFFLILSTSSSQPMVTSGASSGERISVRKRRDRRRSIESRRRRRRLRESGRYAAPPPSAPCSPSAAR